MRPGSGGANANAKGNVAQQRIFGKKHPAKKPGVSRDGMRPRKK